MKSIKKLKATKHIANSPGLYSAKDEAASVYSFTKNMVCGGQTMGEVLTKKYCDMVNALCKKWEAQGGMVGHVKLFLESEEKEAIWISSVGEGVTIKDSQGWKNGKIKKYTLSMTAIVLLMPKVRLEEDVKASIDRYIIKDDLAHSPKN